MSSPFHTSDHPAVLHGQRRRARVEIIPLIDVMFLLVAFFMVVSITMVLQEGIPVNLSQAEMGESAADSSESITLSVTADGTFYLQKEPLDIDSLLDSLSTLASTAPKTSVTINADRETSHGNVVLALDTVRRAGLSNVVIAVEPGR